MNIIELLNNAQRRFELADIDTAKLDAEVLLAHTLGVGRVEIYTMRAAEMSREVEASFNSFVERHESGCPVAYITGVKEFWSIPLKVTQDVLIPRPESEHVVERALEIMKQEAGGRSHEAETTSGAMQILDLCTGSGNIAAALATELPNAHFTLTDVSAAAVEIARVNLKFAEGRTEIFVSDLFDALRSPDLAISRSYDLITANPPYVPTGHEKMLGKEITDYEPEISLYGGKSGLNFIAKIIEEAPAFMKPGAWIVMEMGLGMAEKLELIAGECGGYQDVVISKDLAGIERVISLRRS